MPPIEDLPLNPDTLPSVEDQPWQPISPAYKTVLRCRLLFIGLALLAGLWGPMLWAEHSPEPWRYGLSIVIVIVLGILMALWIPRRVRRTQYLLREQDLHLRIGLWWYSSLSVAINRIQHLEITQGPIERLCGLNALVVYTAGGFQSDLKIPGLESDLAHRIKAHLTHQTTEEEPLNGSHE